MVKKTGGSAPSGKMLKITLDKSVICCNKSQKATVVGLDSLKDPLAIARLRGKDAEELVGARA